MGNVPNIAKTVLKEILQVAALNYSGDIFGNGIVSKSNIIFKYTSGNKNNWIEITKNVNGVDFYKCIREIEYY